MSRLIESIAEHARRIPLQPALSDAVTTVCYGELPSILEQLGMQLDRNCPRSRPVAIHLPNSAAWALLDLALLHRRHPVVPVPTFFTDAQVAHVLEQSGAGCLLTESKPQRQPAIALSVLDRALYCVPQRHDKAGPALAPDTAKVTYTSGSTGEPKGVCLSLRGLEMVAESIVERIGAERAGLHCAVLPLAILLENVAGLYGTLIAGGHYHASDPPAIGLEQPFRPDFDRMVDALAVLRATSVIVVPELLRGMMKVLADTARTLPDLEVLAVGGATVSPLLLAQASTLGLPVIEGYGMTEMASVVALNSPADNVPGSVGRPLRHVRIERAADGELLIRDPLFLGYLGEPGTNGTLHTGDLGRIDADGRIRLLGRKSNVLISSFGRNISPEWVESELLCEPQIVQALVFGDDAPALAALIVPTCAQTSSAEVEQAIERANERLPDYAAVRHWSIVEPFTAAGGQLTGNGRLRRQAIREAHSGRIERMLRHPGLYRSFFERLVADTAAARASFQQTRQIQDALRGMVSLQTYQAYLVEAYHHVKHTVPLMTAALANLKPRQEWLRHALLEYIAEETGHEQWILDDIGNCGGDPQGARSSVPRAATRRMVEYAYDYVMTVNAAGLFGMVFVLEGTSAQLAHRGADSIMSALSLPRNCFRYLLSHGALDVDHMAFFRGVMDRVEDEEDQRAIVTVANSIFHLFGVMFASIPHTRRQ